MTLHHSETIKIVTVLKNTTALTFMLRNNTYVYILIIYNYIWFCMQTYYKVFMQQNDFGKSNYNYPSYVMSCIPGLMLVGVGGGLHLHTSLIYCHLYIHILTNTCFFSLASTLFTIVHTMPLRLICPVLLGTT